MASGFPGVVKQIDRRERGQDADETRETNKLQIMGGGNAIVNFEHVNQTATAEITAIALENRNYSAMRGKCSYILTQRGY